MLKDSWRHSPEHSDKGNNWKVFGSSKSLEKSKFHSVRHRLKLTELIAKSLDYHYNKKLSFANKIVPDFFNNLFSSHEFPINAKRVTCPSIKIKF